MKNVVMGASPNPSRISNVTIQRLSAAGKQVVALGLRSGQIQDVPILDVRQRPPIEDVDTITVYVSEKNLSDYHDYLLSLKPRRIIFNPGAENPVLKAKAEEMGISTQNDCTLVLMSVGAY